MNDYGAMHRAVRRAVAPSVPGTACARCRKPILPGQPWHLDHTDDGAGYLGPSHEKCNTSAGGVKGSKAKADRRRGQRKRITMDVTEWVLAAEIAQDRLHTSIAAAGRSGELIVVELLEYLDGPDAASRVLHWRADRSARAVVIDPHSPGATLIRPLTDAQAEVTEPSASDVAVAHGQFMDELRAGRLRHIASPQLDAAMRHVTERRAGGATALDRRGAAIDTSPAIAAELALWGLLNAPATQPFFGAWR